MKGKIKYINHNDAEMRELTHKLTERVKELNCLYGITKLVETSETSLEEILQGACELIPPAWQYPEVACARIRLKRKKFISKNFKETEWKQTETIFVNGEPYGKVEVFYLQEKPESDEGPFLKEERDLIHAIAERLGHIIDRELADDRLKQLYHKERDLSEKLELEIQNKVDFTRRLIHELKTPLTSLLATSQLLYEETSHNTIGKLAKFVWENACNMNDRIDELHDVIKSEIGKLTLEMKPIDLNIFLSSLVEEAQPLAKQNAMSLNLEMKTRLPFAYADVTRVRQIIFNLLNNAFKYASEGGKVTIRTKANNKHVIIEIQDFGPGIKDEDKERIFKPYYQTPRQQDHVVGLGIGLALCKILVEAHGGEILVKSQNGRGTSFIFTLPRLQPGQLTNKS